MSLALGDPDFLSPLSLDLYFYFSLSLCEFGSMLWFQLFHKVVLVFEGTFALRACVSDAAPTLLKSEFVTGQYPS